MNPKDFSWSENQQVTVTNPTDEPFKFKVHNKDYQLGARKTGRMPGFIAWVYCYNMGQQLALADGRFDEWNDVSLRQEYYEKVFVDADELVQTIEEEPEPAVTSLDIEDPAPNSGGNYTPKVTKDAKATAK